MVNADVPVLQPYVKDGRVKAIVIYDTQRSPYLPDAQRAGGRPAGATNEQLVRRAGRHAAGHAPAAGTGVRQGHRQARAGAQAGRRRLSGPLGAADFQAKLNADLDRWVPMIRQAGIRTE